MATKKKLVAENVEDITKKPAGVRRLWQVASAMDPNGDLFTDDKALVVIAGQGPAGRGIEDLSLPAELKRQLTRYGIYDGAEPDEPKTAKGVIFTVYQLLEMAFWEGVQHQTEMVDKAIVNAARDEDPDEEDTEVVLLDEDGPSPEEDGDFEDNVVVDE